MKKSLIFVFILAAALALASCGKAEITKEETFTPDPVAADYYNQTQTQANGDTTTHRSDRIEQEGTGVKVEIISADVKPGDLCALTIKGEANSEFSIEIYDDRETVLKIEGLKNAESDENGTARWQFFMPDDAKIGAKAVIIRQVGSNNYARTAMYVK